GECELTVRVSTDAAPEDASLQAMLDGPGTVYRSVDATGPTVAMVSLRTFVVDLGRLLIQRAHEAEVLAGIVDLAFKHLAVERVVVLLLEQNGALRQCVSRIRSGGDAIGSISRTVTDRVLTTRAALLVPMVP